MSPSSPMSPDGLYHAPKDLSNPLSPCGLLQVPKESHVPVWPLPCPQWLRGHLQLLVLRWPLPCPQWLRGHIQLLVHTWTPLQPQGAPCPLVDSTVPSSSSMSPCSLCRVPKESIKSLVHWWTQPCPQGVPCPHMASAMSPRAHQPLCPHVNSTMSPSIPMSPQGLCCVPKISGDTSTLLSPQSAQLLCPTACGMPVPAGAPWPFCGPC